MQYPAERIVRIFSSLAAACLPKWLGAEVELQLSIYPVASANRVASLAIYLLSVAPLPQLPAVSASASCQRHNKFQ